MAVSPASVQLWLSRSFRPTQSLAASVLVFTSIFSASPPPPRLSRSFRPTRSLATSSLFLSSALLPFSPKPEPSRSFRPTRSLAASHLLSSSPFPGIHVPTATTQSVIPAHSVTGFTSEHCVGQRYGNDCASNVGVIIFFLLHSRASDQALSVIEV